MTDGTCFVCGRVDVHTAVCERCNRDVCIGCSETKPVIGVGDDEPDGRYCHVCLKEPLDVVKNANEMLRTVGALQAGVRPAEAEATVPVGNSMPTATAATGCASALACNDPAAVFDAADKEAEAEDAGETKPKTEATLVFDAFMSHIEGMKKKHEQAMEQEKLEEARESDGPGDALRRQAAQIDSLKYAPRDSMFRSDLRTAILHAETVEHQLDALTTWLRYAASEAPADQKERLVELSNFAAYDSLQWNTRLKELKKL